MAIWIPDGLRSVQRFSSAFVLVMGCAGCGGQEDKATSGALAGVESSTAYSQADLLPSDATHIEISVVDSEGEISDWLLEIGDYRPGLCLEDLELDTSDRDHWGRKKLARPASPTVVRAVCASPCSEGPLVGRCWSAAVLLDPSKLPTRIELVIEQPIEVGIFPPIQLAEGEELLVEDELGFVVHKSRQTDLAGYFGFILIPGRYTARTREVTGRPSVSRSFIVEAGYPSMAFDLRP